MLHVIFSAKVQRGALEDHGKENTEAHLQLACKKLEEFQGQLAVNANNVEEIQASIGNTDPDKSLVSEINDLSGSIRLSNSSVQVLRGKMAELDYTLKDLRRENEGAVETTEKEITDLTVLVGRNNTRVQELFNKVTQLENTEAHLKLARKKIEEFQGQLAVNANNVKEIQGRIGNTDPDKSLVSEINDLSGSIRLSNRSVQELRYKMALLDCTLKDLQRENKDAVETTKKEITYLTALVGRNNKRVQELFDKVTQLENNLKHLRRRYCSSQSQLEEEFKELKNGVYNDKTRVQNSMYCDFQDLRIEIASIKKRQNDATVTLQFMTVIIIVIVSSILCYWCY